MNRIFKTIDVDYHDRYFPIVTDGIQYFSLDLLGDGSYGTCTEVIDEAGHCKDNDSNVKNFIALYQKERNTLVYSIYGYIIY